MLALEAAGVPLVVGSINPPPDSFRHARLDALEAEVIYPAPPAAMQARAAIRWDQVAPLVAAHDARYGAAFKADVRARNAIYFFEEFRRRGVNHVHVHFANRATHTALFLKRLGLPFSFTAHAQDFMVDLGSDDLLRELCREAEFVVAVSDFSRGLLADRCPDSAEKITRIYNGLDPAEFPAPGPKPPDRPLRIVSVGRLIEFKGFHHLIGSCGLLRERGIAFDLQIIGEGPWRPQLEARIAELGIGDAVRLPGSLDQAEVRAALLGADVFALGCIVDSKGASDILPTVITEAMACRLPVVSTRLVGVPEMVDDGATGFLVPPGDEPALADALAKLAADPAQRQRFGDAGRAKMEATFALAGTAGQLAALLGRGEGAAFAPDPAKGVAIFSDADVGDLFAEADADRIAARAEDGGDPPAFDYLPDAVVLESAWLRRRDLAARCEALRREIGTAAEGEDFFVQARRAVFAAELCARRGYRLIVAAGSRAALWVWLAAKLTGIRAAAAIESDPAAPRALLEKILPDFSAANLADAKLRQKLPAFQDRLALEPPKPQRRRLGPIKWKSDPPQIDRAAQRKRAADWVAELEAAR
ncbi:MAG: glycosyltransferase family 4 protein [Verrucomicrobiales bacterium]